MNLEKVIKTIVGTIFIVPGFSIVMFEVWRALMKNVNVQWGIITIGFIFLFIGGYLIAPVLTNKISDEIAEKVPLLDHMVGGRRKTDPPSPPSIEVADPTIEPPITDSEEAQG